MGLILGKSSAKPSAKTYTKCFFIESLMGIGGKKKNKIVRHFKKTVEAFHILKHLTKCKKRESGHSEPAPTCAPSRMDDM